MTHPKTSGDSREQCSSVASHNRKATVKASKMRDLLLPWYYRSPKIFTDSNLEQEGSQPA